MTKERMIELLKIEHECMRRGAHNECDRDCAKCELVQDDRELDEMYTGVVALLKEQEAKTGKWIPVTNGRGGLECSICHDYAPSYQNGTEYLSKYCPNCGAKMEGR